MSFLIESLRCPIFKPFAWFEFYLGIISGTFLGIAISEFIIYRISN